MTTHFFPQGIGNSNHCQWFCSTTFLIFLFLKMGLSANSCLTISLLRKMANGMASLLQHGILYAVDRPVDIRSFLLSLPGFSAEYIEKTVQTIFINGTAADNLDRPLGCGETLALSAAMPGLAGAIFRRHGRHSSLRSQTAIKEQPGNHGAGYITLKLFNSVAIDRVFDLMSQGILIHSQAYYDYAVRQEKIFQPPVEFAFAGRPLSYAEMLHAVRQMPLVKIQLCLLPAL